MISKKIEILMYLVFWDLVFGMKQRHGLTTKYQTQIPINYSTFQPINYFPAYPGRRMVTVQPGPLLFSAVTVPPISRTNFLTRARPMPVPRVDLVSGFSTR